MDDKPAKDPARALATIEPPVRIREVTSKDDLAAFYALPERLYVNEPLWVPPLGIVERRRLQPALDKGRVKLFLAERRGVAQGRISVTYDPKRNERQGQQVAYFGFFECIEDAEVAAALFDRAREQARQWGMTVLRGPENLSRLEYIGITVEGFETAPPLFQAHHPPFYQRLIEAQGFGKHHDMIAYQTPLRDAYGEPRELPEPLFSKAKSCDIPGLEVRRARWRSMGADIDAASTLFNAAYLTVPDAQPMNRATFQAIGRLYLGLANTEMLQLAFVDGRPVGFAVCLPELNEAVAATRGRLWPVGWLRFGLAFPQIHTAAFKLIGVLPEYRGSGLHAVMIDAVIKGAHRAGYTRLDASVINEDNGPMRGVLEGAGCTPYRRYRIYDRDV